MVARIDRLALIIGIYRRSSAQSGPGARAPQGDRHRDRRRQVLSRHTLRVRGIRDELAPRTPAWGIARAKPAARLIGGIKGLDGGAVFAEGPVLDPERAAKLPTKWIGRILTHPQAQQVLEALES
jgi:hypothetical protein